MIRMIKKISIVVGFVILSNCSQGYAEEKSSSSASTKGVQDFSASISHYYFEIAKLLSEKILSKPENCTIPALKLEALTALRKAIRYNSGLKSKIEANSSMQNALGSFLAFRDLTNKKLFKIEQKLSEEFSGTSMFSHAGEDRGHYYSFESENRVAEFYPKGSSKGTWDLTNTKTVPAQHLLSITINGKTVKFELALVTTAHGDTIFGLSDPLGKPKTTPADFLELPPGCEL